MRKWSKKHRNYIQLQVTLKGSGGQGTQGSCSLHSFLTNLLLPCLNGSLKSGWPVGREAHPFTPHHAHRGFGPSVWPIRTCEVRGHERITESCSLEQSALTLALPVATSRLRSVRFRPR